MARPRRQVEEGQVDRKQGYHEGERRDVRPAPAVDHDPVEEHRRDRHRGRDGNAVGGGEVAGVLEADHEPDAAEHQEPVDQRDVDLAPMALGGVADVEARQVVELHRLCGQRERPGEQCLRGDDRRHRRQDRQRCDRPFRRHAEEGLADLFARRGRQQGRLTEVVEQQRRQHDGVPRLLDGPASEVTHVGVQRLTAGDHEEDRAERKERLLGLVEEELPAVLR